MLIKQLFSAHRDPTRPLNEVINSEEDIDPRSEIDEYVFTLRTEDYLRTVIEGIFDTSQGHSPDCLRGWISGFFGSGKSHFLKLTGALLENRLVRLPDGTEKPALQYAVARHNLDLPWERLAREFKIRAVTVNLALAHGGGKLAQARPLLHRLASELNRAWGYSAVPHIAAIEREIQKRKKWDAFLAAVRDHTEQTGELDRSEKPYEWTHRDIRDFAAEGHRILEIVLPEILPQYANARAYLTDKEAEQPSPETVVQLALDLATSLHPELGRVILCVDEVALYLRGGGAGGFDGDRVREIQGLAETIKNKGRGRIFLFATAQLRVDTIDVAFAGLQDYVVFLKDRFPPGGRLEIEERDIDTVVLKRWLMKDTAESPSMAAIQKLLSDNGGVLASAAKLREENLIRDTAPLTDAGTVLDYYPCLPFHIRLLQAILQALRGEQQIDQTAAQSRALLTSIRALFLSENGANLAEAEIGTLVTFDKIYDVIRGVVRRMDSGTDRWITETIDSRGSCGAVRVSAVAKVIFLLQHLNPHGERRIRVSAENVASLLYPRLGAPWEPHLDDVRHACARLLEEHFVGEQPETGYRFYRADERSFQTDVAAQLVDEATLRESLGAVLLHEVKAMGLDSLTVKGGHRLEVRARVHFGQRTLPNPLVQPSGLELHFVWSPAGAPAQGKLLEAQYANAPHIALWMLGTTGEAEELARRAARLEATLNDYASRLGHQAAALVRGEQAKLGALREGALSQAVRAAIESGTVIHRGMDTVLTSAGKKPVEVFRQTMREAVDQVFPQLEEGSALLNEAALRKVLTWRPPQPQPEFMVSLRLFDAGGQALVDRPFLKEIVLSLQGRPEVARTGKAVLERLAQTTGWPERAVKAGLATLLRARRLTVRVADGTVIRSESDPRAESWLTGTQAFNRSVLELSDFNVTPAERDLLTRLFADVFNQPGLDTIEKLEKEGPALRERLATAREALADLRGRNLPGVDSAQTMVALLQAGTEPDAAPGMLKQLAAKVRDEASQGGNPIGTLKDHARIVEAVGRLRQQGRLERISGVRARTALLYLAWRSQGGGATVSADLTALTAQAGSTALLLKAELALELDERCFQAYAADYRARHVERHRLAALALARLEAHPAWSQASAAVREEARGAIQSLDCVNSADLVLSEAPDGRCVVCRASYSELAGILELIEAREQKALRALGDTDRPSRSSLEPSLPPADSLTMELHSPADLPRLYERIGKLAAKVLVRPRRVSVVFEDKEP